MTFILDDQQDTAIEQENLIKDVGAAEFMTDVIEASQEVPIIVDFWAPWCGPCKQLGPLLEDNIKKMRGAMRMVKVNIDNEQALAAQLRIQSVPTVYAFFQGRPIDGFQGALPDSQIKAFLAKIKEMTGAGQDSPAEVAMAEAKEALAEGDAEKAEQLFQEVLVHEEDNLEALGGFIQANLKLGNIEAVKETLASLSPQEAAHPDVQAAQAAYDLACQAEAAGSSNELEAKALANPDDFEVQLEYAVACYGDNQAQKAIDILLEMIRKDRSWHEEAARKQLVTFFEALGPTDPLTIASRKRLSSILFS